MFHCYRRKDDDSGDLSTLSFGDEGSSSSSVMSRVKTRSNYSAVLTMGLPHAIELGALTLFRKRTRSAQETRHLFRYQSMNSTSDYEMETLSIKEPPEQKTRYRQGTSAFGLRSISIDVPLLNPQDERRNMLVSYSHADNRISIVLQAPAANVSRDVSGVSLRDARALSDAGLSPNELTDISAGESIISGRTANIELSQFENGIRMGKKSGAKSDGPPVTYGGLVESQIVAMELDPYSSLNNATPPLQSHEVTCCDQICNTACLKLFFSYCCCCCNKRKQKI